MKRSTSWTGTLSAAVFAASAQSAFAMDNDYSEYSAAEQTYFDTDNWGNDEYGIYDEDFEWTTDDEWYDDWNETDLTAWNDAGEAQWDTFGYEGGDEWDVFDW